MRFCKQCKNMYYLKLSDKDTGEGSSQELQYYCRKCGHVDTETTADTTIVSHTQLKKNKASFKHIVNRYTRLDPTLPRITTIPCPNSECPSNIDKSSKTTRNAGAAVDDDDGTENIEPQEREIIYIRYDNEDMKYVYLCAICDHTFTTTKN